MTVSRVTRYDHELFSNEKTPKWRGSKAIVPLTPETCPDCGESLRSTRADQLPLLRHGGYGAISSSRIVSCPCGYVLDAQRTSENPRGSL